MRRLTIVLYERASNSPVQLWASPLMHALYIFACVRAPSDRNEQILKDPTKFPFPYLWLLWCSNWVFGDGTVWHDVRDLCQLMSQAITDSRSNYKPSDAIISVDHFVASSGTIGENELRVFFYAMDAGSDSMAANDNARLLFFASLALKLCQQSSLSMFKIFSILIRRLRDGMLHKVNQELSLFHILPLLRILRRSCIRDNTVVDGLNVNHSPSSELNGLIVDIISFCSKHLREPEDVYQHGIIMALSLLAAPSLISEAPIEGRSPAYRIVCRVDVNIWRGAFEYFDCHRKSDYLS
jgi:hypothetical protein